MSAENNNPQPQRLLRIFLCHSSDDRVEVRALYQKLIDEGFDPWLDEEDLMAGQDWQREIPRAVRGSDVVLICLSKKSINKAGYIQKEIKYALDVADEQPEGTIFLIPVRLEECSIPERLSLVQWINLFDTRGYERLVRALSYRAGTLGITTSNADNQLPPPSENHPAGLSGIEEAGGETSHGAEGVSETLTHVNAEPEINQDSIQGTEIYSHKEWSSVGNTNVAERLTAQGHDSSTAFSKISGRLKRAPGYLIWLTALIFIAGGAAFVIFFAARNKALLPTNGNPAARNEPSPPAADVAATVNGEPILLSKVNALIKQQMKGQDSKPLSAVMLRSAQLQVLGSMIERELLFQRAEKEGLLPTENEITQKITETKAENRMTDEQYQKMLREADETEQSLRVEARRDLAIQKLQDKMAARITIDDKEIDEFYKQNEEKFFVRTGVGLSDIVSDPADNAMLDDVKNADEAKEKISRIYRALQDGADFATLARTSSEDANSTRGGDIGFATVDDLKKNDFPPKLITAFFNTMQVGSFTEPVKFNSGIWYIFKLTDRRLKDEKLTLDSPGVRDQIKQALTDEQKKILEAQLLETLKNSAAIVNHLASQMPSK